MESGADTHRALAAVPQTILDHLPTINMALAGTLSTLLLGPAIEDELIHFLYARNTNGEPLPAFPQHRTLRITDYLRSLDNDECVGVEDCWRELSQLSHPSAFTIHCFLKDEDDGIALHVNPDLPGIVDLCTRYRSLVTFCLKVPVEQCLLTLHALNLISDPALRTPGLPFYGLESTETGRKLEEVERKARIP